MTIEQIKEYLHEAREKGWWIAALYWEIKLDKLEAVRLTELDRERYPQN